MIISLSKIARLFSTVFVTKIQIAENPVFSHFRINPQPDNSLGENDSRSYTSDQLRQFNPAPAHHRTPCKTPQLTTTAAHIARLPTPPPGSLSTTPTPDKILQCRHRSLLGLLQISYQLVKIVLCFFKILDAAFCVGSHDIFDDVPSEEPSECRRRKT
jgi:hypothetical protein